MTPTTSRATRRVLAPACLGVAALAALAGCGGSGGSKPATTAATPRVEDGVQVFDVTGTTTLQFTPNELDAKPGRIRVNFSVPKQSPPHDFVAAAIPGAKTDVVSAGSSAQTTFTVNTPGTYQFVCTIHSNMQGVLKVG